MKKTTVTFIVLIVIVILVVILAGIFVKKHMISNVQNDTNAVNNTTNSSSQELSKEQIENFNKKIMSYVGTTQGETTVSVIKEILDLNNDVAKEGINQIVTVKMNGEVVEDIKSMNFYKDKSYDVTIAKYDSNGCISEIDITEK